MLCVKHFQAAFCTKANRQLFSNLVSQSLLKNELSIFYSKSCKHLTAACQNDEGYSNKNEKSSPLMTNCLRKYCNYETNRKQISNISQLWSVQSLQTRYFKTQCSDTECTKCVCFSSKNCREQNTKEDSRLKTSKVKENIKTIPNLLTTLRLLTAPVFVYLISTESYGFASGLFMVAGFSDMLDGYIARNFKNQRTSFGTALDPFADKILMSVLTVSLTSVGMIPLPLAVLILGRDGALLLGGFYIRWKTLSPPKTAKRYFDGSHVTVTFDPSNLSKVNTLFQLSFVAATLASPVFDWVGHPMMQVLMYTTAATTFLSGADYMMSWRTRIKEVKN